MPPTFPIVRRRTSQLQIRITEAERVALRRLAEAAGTTISAYVLAQALPRSSPELARLIAELPASGNHQRARLQEIADLIGTLSPDEIGNAAPPRALDDLPPPLANQVAALLERAAHDRGVPPPAAASTVRPLERPSFAWALPSLRVHQLRVAPVAFKRRNVYFDPTSNRALPRPLSRAQPSAPPPPTAVRPPDPSDAAFPLWALDRALAATELVVEFYYLGGAVLSQAFPAHLGTARPTAQLAPAGRIDEAVSALSREHGWSPDAITRALRHATQEGHRYVDLPRVRAFAPHPGYVFGLFVLGLRGHPTPHRLEDLRYLLRTLNVDDPEEALAMAARYVPQRHLPAEAKATLDALLGP